MIDRRWFPCFLVSLALVASPSAEAKKKDRPPPRFLPVAVAEGDVALVDGAWVKELPGITLVLKRLDTLGRQEYLAHQLGFTADPFGVSPGKPERYQVFQLVIQNRTDGEISFNPRSAWLMPSNREVQTPLGLTDLSFDYRSLGGELPPAYEKIRSVLFEQTVAVRSGQAVSGLLAYRPVNPKAKNFYIDLRIVNGKADVIPMKAIYVREDKIKKPKGEPPKPAALPEPVPAEETES